MGPESRYDFIHLRDNGRRIIGYDAVIHHLVAFPGRPAGHPLAAFVFLDAAGGGHRQDRYPQMTQSRCFVFVGSHG
jgi:hypothetical protein